MFIVFSEKAVDLYSYLHLEKVVKLCELSSFVKLTQQTFKNQINKVKNASELTCLKKVLQ